MAQIKILKIDATLGIHQEHDSAADDLTFNSYTAGAGPVMSPTGIDMNNTDVSDIQDAVFNDPTTGTINQTAGNLVIDNIMAKERNNSMTTAGAILFPLVTNVGGELDSFKVPHIAGAPSATPSFSTDAGYLVFDDTNNNLYIWDGAAWDNLNEVESANNIDNTYIAEVGIAARDVVYISSADNVSPAQANAEATGRVIGFATAAALAAANVPVRSEGILDGFAGLTAGSRYFLSAATAGLITTTPPSGASNVVFQVGMAKSATALHLQLQHLGRRAA
ncbi:MAG: hypothetical protein HC836_47750 [Richelia sp. RM2_1_2]|nr:hypothetical protein [Richelia sp. RM2_1_2]